MTEAPLEDRRNISETLFPPQRFLEIIGQLIQISIDTHQNTQLVSDLQACRQAVLDYVAKSEQGNNVLIGFIHGEDNKFFVQIVTNSM